MRLKTRILVIIMASLAGLVAMGAFSLYSVRQTMLEERQARISVLLDFAKAQMSFFQKQEASGKMSREEAQSRAVQAIQAQQTEKDYFIVRDLADNRLLVHATASRIGKIDPGGKMPDGRSVNDLYKEKIKASPDGKGFVLLNAARPNSEDKTKYSKLNGATIFEPWNWMIAIGFFVDDVDAKFWEQSSVFFGVSGVVLILLLTITFQLLRSLNRSLSGIQSVMKNIRTSNDFTQKVTVSSRDEIGLMAMDFNELLGTLQEAFSHFKTSISSVFNASESFVNASERSANASALTSEAASSMSASVDQMSVSINQVSENAQSASVLARKTGQLSGEGGEVISSTVKEMHQIADAIDSTALAIGDLGQQSNKISSIVQVIKEVADQTNLLALNAAIEAARAGEAGRGFSVVADEVRKLAERTSLATGEITSMIGNIQVSSQSAVDAMQRTVEQVKSGRTMAEHAGESIIEIRQAAVDVVNIVEDIAASIAEQTMASQSFAQQLERVSKAVEENKSASEETSDVAHHLDDLASQMQDMAAKFTI